MAIENGIIVGALDPDNEGQTPLQVIVREANAACETANAHNNTFAYLESGQLSPESVVGRLKAALAGSQDHTGAVALLAALNTDVQGPNGSANILQAIEHYMTSRKLINALLDCGVLPDMSNLQAVVEGALGVGAKANQAIANFQRSAAIFAVMDGVVTYALLSALGTAVEAVADSVRDNVKYMARV